MVIRNMLLCRKFCITPRRILLNSSFKKKKINKKRVSTYVVILRCTLDIMLKLCLLISIISCEEDKLITFCKKLQDKGAEIAGNLNSTFWYCKQTFRAGHNTKRILKKWAIRPFFSKSFIAFLKSADEQTNARFRSAWPR